MSKLLWLVAAVVVSALIWAWLFSSRFPAAALVIALCALFVVGSFAMFALLVPPVTVMVVRDPRVLTEFAGRTFDRETRDLNAARTIGRIKAEVLPGIANPSARKRVAKFLDQLPLRVVLRRAGRGGAR